MKNPKRVAGGKRGALKNKAKDPNFFRKIGALGGRASGSGGFAYAPEKASEAGRRGGLIAQERRRAKEGK